MRISDWSSDVCSSDLGTQCLLPRPAGGTDAARRLAQRLCRLLARPLCGSACPAEGNRSMSAVLQSGTQSDTRAIVVDEVFPHKAEVIWKAITTGERTGRWLMKPNGFGIGSASCGERV